ncbi:MAG: fructosamine kinase family protein [Proteobacteria bacterium]|nr:fructosamine kinase family protein [Pseudomonadota bacterium]
MYHLGDEPNLSQVKLESICSIPILSRVRAGGATQTPAWFAKAQDGRQLFIKQDDSGSGLLLAEAEGLQALAAANSLATPTLLAYDAHWLVMLAIPREAASKIFWQSLGRGLAKLHRQTGAIGWPSDNWIGRSRQLNTWTPAEGSWADFFWQRRLLPQIHGLRYQGLWSKDAEAKLEEQVMLHLGPVEEEPSLLHGDLWSGNILCGESQLGFLIDPSVYYGHREVDIAMSELFGGFSRSFYQAYEEVWPLAKGYHQRKNIYNLYHKMNHVQLYGSGYIWDLQQSILHITRS